MALEFPEGFPFNRPHPAVKSEQVQAEPQQQAEAPQAEMPLTKADADFEAAIAEEAPCNFGSRREQGHVSSAFNWCEK